MPPSSLAARARAALLCLLALVAPRALGAAQTDAPALSIDGAPVSFEAFAAWLLPFQGEAQVEDFAHQLLLRRAAAAEGVEVPRESARARVEERITARVEGAFGGDRAAWRDELARLGQSEAEFRAEAELEAWLEELARRLVARRRTVAESEVRAAWEDRYGPGGRRPDLRWIRLEVPPPAQPPGTTRDEAAELARAARAAVEARALALRAELAAGLDFAAAARAQSDDPHSRATGGRLRPGESARSFGVEVATALAALEPGQLSAPIYARGGFNLFLVAGMVETPFETVAADLERELAEAPPDAAEAAALRAELFDGVTIEVLPELGREVRGDDAEPASWRLDRPVLRVDDALVTRGEFAGWLCATHGRPFVQPYAEARLVERAAARRGVSASSAEVERRVADDVARTIEVYFAGDRDAWLAHLAERGLTEAAHLRARRIQTRVELLAERCMLAERALTEADLRRAWEDRYGPGGRSPDVRYLVRELDPPAEGQIETREELERYVEAARARTGELMEGLRARIEAGEDFATLVELYSQDAATRDRGGRPEGRFELHAWPEQVRAAIEALRPGQVTPPIELSYTFYLFQLVGLRVVPFDEVREELARALREQRPSMVEVASWVNALSKDHDVRALPGLFARRPGPAR